MQFSYHARLETDARRWVEKGMIDTGTAEALVAESASQKRSYSFSSIIIVLGVVCLCFAAMTFVAANWEDMPRLVRVGLLVAAMWAAYLIAAFVDRRDMPILSQAMVTLGCGVFGAAIMLVGQMYHLQGRAEDAVLLWAAGTLAAALLLRAPITLWLAIALFSLWLYLDTDNLDRVSKLNINYLYLLFWAACAAGAFWLRSRASAHLLVIGMVIWLAITMIILTQRYDTPAFAHGLYAAFFAFIALAIASHERGPYLRGFEAPIVVYMALCIGFMIGGWMLASSFGLSENEIAEVTLTRGSVVAMAVFLALGAAVLADAVRRKSSSVYDMVFCLIWIAAAGFGFSSIGMSIPFYGEAYALAISIWLIRMGGRQAIPMVTRLGYLGFVLIMLLIYFRTAGTLLGTAGFYLTAGLFMVLGAVFLPKILRSRKQNAEAAQ